MRYQPCFEFQLDFLCTFADRAFKFFTGFVGKALAYRPLSARLQDAQINLASPAKFLSKPARRCGCFPHGTQPNPFHLSERNQPGFLRRRERRYLR
jgi:hypothetical protein